MAKRYAVTLSTGHTLESSSPHEAHNWRNFDGQHAFSLSGKPATREEFFAAARAACEAAWDKKNQTHKRVRVLHGSSAGCYVEKWVRR